jgi:hypothetical protein
MNIPSTKFISKVITSLIIEFRLRFQPRLSFWVVLDEGNLLIDLLSMEDVIGGLALWTFILVLRDRYGLSLKRSSSSIEL